MEAARWIVAFVAVVTAIGGLCADWLIPFGAKQHLKNPAWRPHAKFHNAQSMLMGLGQGLLALIVLFKLPLGSDSIVIAASVASLYWGAMMLSPLFPGTAWVDPEFVDQNPRPLGMAPPQLIGWVLLGLLAIAIAMVFAPL